jgi:hypothetical protein
MRQGISTGRASGTRLVVGSTILLQFGNAGTCGEFALELLGRFLWRSMPEDSDELLNLKQFETLPKLRGLTTLIHCIQRSHISFANQFTPSILTVVRNPNAQSASHSPAFGLTED